jgi:peroxiredoxin
MKFKTMKCMRVRIHRRSLVGALALASALHVAAADWPEEVPNFSMLDVRGRYHEFHRTHSKAVVLFFTENGCPISRQDLHKLKDLRNEFSESDADIWAVDSSTGDDRDSIESEANHLHLGHAFPFMRDESQGVARLLGVTRTATVVAISAKDGHVFYHGALDDQLSEGAAKPGTPTPYLEDALHSFLAGAPVKQPVTQAHGCLISFDAKIKGSEVSYARDVAPILEKHCVQCHSAGNIGPFALSDFKKVKSKSDMIQEVVLSRRMPPWSADTEVGHYEHERTMTVDETRTLLGWIAQGAPRGDGADPLADLKVPPAPEWPLGKPDYILKLPKPEEIPATGVLEYRHIKIQSPVTEDTWLGAVAIKPGNRKVLHHCILRMQTKGGGDDGSGRGEWLQGWAPGLDSERYPEGTGRLLTKDSTLEFELHYTPNGVAQTDDTEIGLYKLPAPPKSVVEIRGAYNIEFTIAPGAAEAETESVLAIPRDTLLYAMFPHMHLRGSWMRYEALYPSGDRELLLSVPHYDFNWQTGYQFPQPKKLPAGTWILCTGGFDNSPENPSNPGPSQRVEWGDQSFNEMFVGFVEMSDVPKPQGETASK